MLGPKVAVVTGAGQGLGRGIALEMARQGAAGIAAVDLDLEAAEESAELARRAGADAVAIGCDLRDRDQIEAMVAGAAARFDGFDVLVNNAGIIETNLTRDCSVETLSEDLWDAVYEVNLRAPWLATKYAAPHLRRSTRGPSIVNAGSIASLVAFSRAPAYCATKGGIAMLTKATAVDLAPIRCNAYCPGAIATPMARDHIETSDDPRARERTMVAPQIIERMGTPEEVGKLVCFLASDAAAFVNGALYVIDGGHVAWGQSH